MYCTTHTIYFLLCNVNCACMYSYTCFLMMHYTSHYTFYESHYSLILPGAKDEVQLPAAASQKAGVLGFQSFWVRGLGVCNFVVQGLGFSVVELRGSCGKGV